MRQTIRALGWVIKILWVITLLLPITIGVSLSKLLEPNAIGFGESSVSFSNRTVSLSSPFYINNKGYYDLSDMDIAIHVENHNKAIATVSKLLPNVPAGATTNSSYDITFNLEEITSESTELWTSDTDLNLSISASFRVAYVITLGVSTNTTMRWGAPFFNLTMSQVSYDFSTQKFSVSVFFENHADFPVNGMLRLEIYNDMGEPIGSISESLNVPSRTPFQARFESHIEPSKITDHDVIRIYFENLQVLEKRWSLSE